MRYIKIKTLPKILFAHSFGADKYDKSLPVRKNRIEISYVKDGYMVSDSIYKEKYGISCNIFDRETHITSSSFHEHHTVCFNLEFDVSDTKAENSILIPEYLTCPEYSRAHELIDKIIQIHTLYPEDELSVSGMFLELISEITMLSEQPRDIKASIYAEKAKEYVFSHLHEQITQREVADALHITPEYLCAVFKRANGVTFIKFVNQTKLVRIKDAIKREGIKLYEAAELYGYSDPNYVSRLIKKYGL